MKIAFNIDGLLGGVMTGVQHYSNSLLTALYESGTSHNIVAFLPQVWSPNLLTDPCREDGFEWLAHPHAVLDTARTNCYLPLSLPGARAINRRLLHPLRARATRLTEWSARRAAARYDILHTPGMARPEDATYRARRNVCTLYDMTVRTHAWAHSAENIAASEAAFAYAKTCDRVLTISEFSREEICTHLGIASDRVDVAPLAPRIGTHPVTASVERDSVLAPLGLDNGTPFALYAGTLEPRKNLARLLCAWAMACRELHDHVLVLAGGAWPGEAEKLRAQVQNLGIADRVLFTGYTSNAVLNTLMSACAAFAYVSESEGFGLPPLEAMACGAPVVASNTTSLPEVVGDAGILVNPLDVEAIASALYTLLTDAGENSRLRRLSAQRAQGFSWFHTAQKTLTCYEAAVR